MKREKTRHSFFGNMFYVLKLCAKHNKWTIPVTLIRSLLTLLTEMVNMYFATALTWYIENQKGLASILGVTLALVLFSWFVGLIHNKLNEINGNYQIQLNRHFDIVLGEKIMKLDFGLIEGPTGRNKYQKAKNALGDEGLYGFFFYMIWTVISLFGIFSYGAITVSLSPWLALILIGSQVLALTSTALESCLIDKTKDPLAEIDRKLACVTKTSRDFAIAKDIRIFRFRNYLQQISEYFIGEKKIWTQKMYFYYFLSDSLKLFLDVGIEIGVFSYIAYKSYKGELSSTELVLYAISVLEFSRWVSNIGESVSETIPLSRKIDDFREFLSLKNTPKKENALPLPEEKPYEIKLNNVSFTYPESDKVILENINLTVSAGEKLALVGLNGAGKTTLVKLLCGLYTPTQGEILLNGINTEEFDRNEYYSVISAVFQEAQALPVSVLENVSMLPARESDSEKAIYCLKQSGLYDTIQTFPEKENSLMIKNVNENAVELSGGEMQRLLLARAIYKNSPILILDEPTAALDPIAENEVYLQYNSLSKDKTSVYISHRLSSTRFCDRIVLLSNSKIAETGTYEELMALDGEYAQLFRIQSKYYEKEGEESA